MYKTHTEREGKKRVKQLMLFQPQRNIQREKKKERQRWLLTFTFEEEKKSHRLFLIGRSLSFLFTRCLSFIYLVDIFLLLSLSLSVLLSRAKNNLVKI